MKLTYQDKTKEDWFLVSWTLSNKCNYRCSYCPDHLHSGSTGQPRWDTVERFVKGFKQPKKNICYRLSGGEPTYWKHFTDLAKLVKQQGHTFTFLTNGSHTVEYYKTISEFSDGYIISYHPEYADINHIMEVIQNSNCPVFINLMLAPDNFEQMFNVAEALYNCSDNVAIWPKIILDKSNIDAITNTPYNYSQEQLDTIKKWPFFRPLPDSNLHRGGLLLDDKPVTANDLISTDRNKFQGWKCWAGLHMINIDMWGNMYRADCQEGGPLGNIERYKLPKETIICGKQSCACLSDIYLRKETA
jgi:organic radical activating enzyme|tara:strand:+ start:1732 stop:2637 length:906 start_codon:yes stop_codon:yes gene_type:complete